MDDFSSEDEAVYDTTNVTLGYTSTETTGDDVSHTGGFAVFSTSSSKDEIILTTLDMARCGNNSTCHFGEMPGVPRSHFPPSAAQR
jgi:hypothetical protein